MNLLKQLFIFFILFGISSVFSQNSSIDVNFSNVDSLYTANEYEKGFQLLNKIKSENHNQLSKKHKILLLVDYSKRDIYNKNYSDALVKLLKAQKLNLFDSTKYQNIYNSTFAELFYELGAIDLSITYFKKYIKNEQDPFNLYLVHNRIGTLYLKLSKTKEALNEFETQYRISKNFTNKVSHPSALNNIALVYYKEKKHEKALELFKEVSLATAKLDNEKNFHSLVQGNIGRTLYWMGNYKEALPFLKNYFDFSFSDNDFLLDFSMQKNYGIALVKLNEIEEAKKMDGIASKYFDQMSIQAKIDYINFKIFLANVQHNSGLVEKLIEKLDLLFIDLKRETRLNQNETSKLVTSYLIEEAKAKLEMDKKEKAFYASKSNVEKREKKLIYIFLTGLFIFIGVSTFVFFQQLKNNKKKLELEKEAQRIESEKERLKLSNWAKE